MSKRQELRARREREQRTRNIIVIVGGGLVVLAIAAVLIISNLPKAPKPVGEITQPALVTRPQANGHSMGDPNAPVKIVEYSDYQCPYCANFWRETEQQVIDTYIKTGKVYFTYHSFGNWVSDNINSQAGTDNKESETAAMASYCASDQSKFWEYRDYLFANQNGENQDAFARNRLDAFAEKLGLDMTAFKECMDSNKYAAQVAQDQKDGLQAISAAPNYDGKGYGTPFFIVNGKLINGAVPFTTFQQEIDAALAAAGK
jgi:protein-disulfide isomerase